MVAPLGRRSGKRSLHRWSWQVLEGAMLVNTGISGMVRSKLSCTSLLSFIVWIRRNSPRQNQRIIWWYQVRGWLPLWPSIPKVQTRKKASFSITDITNQYFRKLLKKFNNLTCICYKSKQVHNEPTEEYFFPIKHITKLIKSRCT